MEWSAAEYTPVPDENALTCFISERSERGLGALYIAGWGEIYPELIYLPEEAEKRWLDARALIYGTAWKKYLSPREAIKTACADALKTACKLKLKKVRLILDGPCVCGEGGGALIRDLARAAGIAAWSFDLYREKRDKAWDSLALEFVFGNGYAAQFHETLKQAFDLALSVNFARGLINEPGNVLTPPVFADRAAAMAEECGLRCTVLDRAALTAGEYAGILTVGQGSGYEPRMVIVQYRPDGEMAGTKKETLRPRHIALVGKGITFDTGGISLKSSKDMHAMKDDMTGAAVVLGAMRSLSKLKPDCTVTALLVCAENHISSSAQRPGDIFRHKSGKYIQVDNTDAEGRLCLIDGFYRAGEEGADTIVDIATLTGACQRALGTSLAGLFGNDDALIEELRAAGKSAGEELWPFPLVEEYARQLETPHADFSNVGGAYAGHIIAALFLRNFVPAKARWAHIDVCPAYFENGWKYYSPGGTAFGLQLLVDWIMDYAAPRG
jgi:leucyl aminopeptidase